VINLVSILLVENVRYKEVKLESYNTATWSLAHCGWSSPIRNISPCFLGFVINNSNEKLFVTNVRLRTIHRLPQTKPSVLQWNDNCSIVAAERDGWNRTDKFYGQKNAYTIVSVSTGEYLTHSRRMLSLISLHDFLVVRHIIAKQRFLPCASHKGKVTFLLSAVATADPRVRSSGWVNNAFKFPFR